MVDQDQERACGGGWEVVVTADHRRDLPFGSGRAGPALSARCARSPAPGAFSSGEGGRGWAAGEIMMMGPLVSPTLRLTAATLGDRGRTCGGGWGDPGRRDHRRDLHRIWSRRARYTAELDDWDPPMSN